MKIVINGKFLTQRITGVQRYAREILKELDKICGESDIELAVPFGIKDFPQYENIRIVEVGKFHGNLWEQISFPRYVKKLKGVSLNLCNSAPLSGKKVITIHDVKIKAHPEFFSKKFLAWYNILFKNITKKSEKIITVSEFSKREIIKYYKVSPEKIHVIGNAWQHFERLKFDEGALKKYGLRKNEFYFSMSSLEPNKNLQWIINAAENNKDSIFAVAGGINNKVFLQKETDSPENVKFLGYISDEEAKTLMRDCKAFLYPTIYEGFGIPPLEAISSGAKNIVVSDSEIMHEILEDSAIYVNPFVYNFKIEEVIDKENSFDQILAKFSWRRSAEELYDCLIHIAK